MRLRTVLLVSGMVMGVAGGCDSPKPQTPPVPPAAVTSTNVTSEARPLHLDHAQPRLATVKLWIGAKEIDAELCLTRTQVATGLMYRPGIEGDESMLFVFPQAQQVGFYMKNVGFDIDAAYIDSAGVVQQIVRLKRMDETPLNSTSNDIQFVLETAPGWWERNGLGVGALVKAQGRTLRQQFGLN